MTPIEEKFWGAAEGYVIPPYLHPKPTQHIDDLTRWFSEERALRFAIARQVEWGAYTADFVVIGRRSGDPLHVVVECDGHDFHEKTKDQAKRDKKRDRYFAKQGAVVMRFTGSELWEDPHACVDEVMACLVHHNAMGVMPEVIGLVHDPADCDLPWQAKCIAEYAIHASNPHGVARISLDVLCQLISTTEREIAEMAGYLWPFMSMRTIDTNGRIVFRLHDPAYWGSLP